jgi:peptidoglycan/xylan/chitin deacetylase (PgdA/CDA1 family)
MIHLCVLGERLGIYFKEYNARVTFFVTRPHKLEPDEVEILQNLQNDGHEITCHGLNHKNLRDMMEDDDMTLDEVIASEITPAIDALANHGFSPLSFAYPFGGYNDELVDGLGELFPLQRKSGSLRYKKLLEPNMLYSFVKGSSIDYKNVPDFDDIEDALEEAYDQDKWIVFYTHKILHSGSPSPSQPYIKVKTLKKILKKANDLGMPFHTMNRLASPP